MKKITVLAVLACCSQIATAQHNAWGLGQMDCGQWIADGRNTDKAWLLGHLSGLNLSAVMAAHNRKGAPPSIDPLSTLGSAKQAFLWMDNWCRANPLKRVGEGSLTLYLELTEKALKK